MNPIVGILNVTPDSFSDGGGHADISAILDTVSAWQEVGINCIDIGAESTRPGATPIDSQTEWKRLETILPEVRKTFPRIIVSLDTRHADNAAKAIDVGVDWINDVSGVESDSMKTLLSKTNTDIVVMHNLGVPADKTKVLDAGLDPVEVVLSWAREKIAELEYAGIDDKRIILDPGVGFGKNAVQSIEMLRRVEIFKSLGVRLLVGHSRKSFMQSFIGGDMHTRDVETSWWSKYLLDKGVDYIRVHNVAMHSQLLDFQEVLANGVHAPLASNIG